MTPSINEIKILRNNLRKAANDIDIAISRLQTAKNEQEKKRAYQIMTDLYETWSAKDD